MSGVGCSIELINAVIRWGESTRGGVLIAVEAQDLCANGSGVHETPPPTPSRVKELIQENDALRTLSVESTSGEPSPLRYTERWQNRTRVCRVYGRGGKYKWGCCNARQLVPPLWQKRPLPRSCIPPFIDYAPTRITFRPPTPSSGPQHILRDNLRA